MSTANSADGRTPQGAPAAEGPMMAQATPVSKEQEKALGTSSETYSVSSHASAVSMLTCGCAPVCTVKNESSGATFVMTVACMGYSCYLDEKYMGKVTYRLLPNCAHIFPYAATLRDPQGKVLARSYISESLWDCCGWCTKAFVLEIVSKCTLRAGSPWCSPSLNYRDESKPGLAIQFRPDTGCGSGEAIVMGDIPIWAVALLPFRKANDSCISRIQGQLKKHVIMPFVRSICSDMGLPDSVPFDMNELQDKAMDQMMAAAEAQGEEEEEEPAEEEELE